MSAFSESIDPSRRKASSNATEKERLDGKGADAATATAEAKLNQLHYELAKGLDPKRLQAFMSDEIKSNTEKLIKSMERLDSRLGVVKEMTGIHARQFAGAPDPRLPLRHSRRRHIRGPVRRKQLRERVYSARHSLFDTSANEP